MTALHGNTLLFAKQVSLEIQMFQVIIENATTDCRHYCRHSQVESLTIH